MDFGAFVNFFGKRDGLVHISQLANERVNKVTDIVNEGDMVKVKFVGFDRGKVKLSMKNMIKRLEKKKRTDKNNWKRKKEQTKILKKRINL